ncbi:MAG: ABC transporter permease [Eubacteriaceae bacterium]|nr:ABC transporter permease [Eubacteriaceae bacterium]
MRESVSYWKDGFTRLLKKKLAMTALAFIVFVLFFAFVFPSFYPYRYEQQIRGSEDLRPFEYSQEEQAKIDGGESVAPHYLGTDSLGRDMMIRIMMGTRISLLVGLIASFIILIIGSVYGAISGYFGGRTDMIMMRIVDIIYTVPDILVIILLMVTLKEPLKILFEKNEFLSKLGVIGPGLIAIFITFSLLYWVGMARIIRGQVMMIKEQEFVTAARALGASSSRIITKHLLPNCIGTIIVTTTLQIPSAIFTESFLSFLGLGVSAPMPSLGSLAADAISGITSYTYRLIAPAVVISIIILAFNLLGDGLRDVFDPKLKK